MFEFRYLLPYLWTKNSFLFINDSSFRIVVTAIFFDLYLFVCLFIVFVSVALMACLLNVCIYSIFIFLNIKRKCIIRERNSNIRGVHKFMQFVSCYYFTCNSAQLKAEEINFILLKYLKKWFVAFFNLTSLIGITLSP